VAGLPTTEYVAECFWPGVDETAVHALDARAGECADDLTSPEAPVRYLGSILMREDEVVLCLYEGTEAAVRRAAARAEIPFERILEATGSPWPILKNPREGG
jgi:hypothetical protein